MASDVAATFSNELKPRHLKWLFGKALVISILSNVVMTGMWMLIYRNVVGEYWGRDIIVLQALDMTLGFVYVVYTKSCLAWLVLVFRLSSLLWSIDWAPDMFLDLNYYATTFAIALALSPKIPETAFNELILSCAFAVPAAVGVVVGIFDRTTACERTLQVYDLSASESYLCFWMIFEWNLMNIIFKHGGRDGTALTFRRPWAAFAIRAAWAVDFAATIGFLMYVSYRNNPPSQEATWMGTMYEAAGSMFLIVSYVVMMDNRERGPVLPTTASTPPHTPTPQTALLEHGGDKTTHGTPTQQITAISSV